MSQNTLKKPLQATTECGICFEEKKTLTSCGNQNCKFLVCEECITEYNNPNCPACTLESNNYKRFQRATTNTPEETINSFFSQVTIDESVWNSLYGIDDTRGCCIIKNETSRFRCAICDIETNYCTLTNSLITLTIPYLAYFCGNLIQNLSNNYILCSFKSAAVAPLHTVLTGCACMSSTILCFSFLDNICRKAVITSDTRYYALTMTPPSLCIIKRDITPENLIVPL